MRWLCLACLLNFAEQVSWAEPACQGDLSDQKLRRVLSLGLKNKVSENQPSKSVTLRGPYRASSTFLEMLNRSRLQKCTYDSLLHSGMIERKDFTTFFSWSKRQVGK